METVKFSLNKNPQGGRNITIEKDGGFNVSEVARVMNVVEQMFERDTSGDQDIENDDIDDVEDVPDEGGDEEEDSSEEQEGGEDEEEDEGGGTKHVGQKTPSRPGGQGKPAGELPDGTKLRHDGQIDGRSLRGRTDPNQLEKEPFVDRLKKATGTPPGRGDHNKARSTAQERAKGLQQQREQDKH